MFDRAFEVEFTSVARHDLIEITRDERVAAFRQHGSES
jgi:hypothetical protein